MCFSPRWIYSIYLCIHIHICCTILCRKDRANLNIFFIGSLSLWLFLSLSLSLCLSFISYLQCVVQVSLALSLSFIVSFLHVISHHFAIFLSLINIIIIFSSSSFDNVGVVESGVHLIYIKKPDRLTMTRKQQLRKKIAFVFLHFILLFLALLFFAFLLIFFRHILLGMMLGTEKMQLKSYFLLFCSMFYIFKKRFTRKLNTQKTQQVERGIMMVNRINITTSSNFLPPTHSFVYTRQLNINTRIPTPNRKHTHNIRH